MNKNKQKLWYAKVLAESLGMKPGDIIPLQDKVSSMTTTSSIADELNLDYDTILTYKKLMDEKEREQNKPKPIKCCDCGQVIGTFQPTPVGYYGIGLLGEIPEKDGMRGVYCHTCWKIRKLKE